MPDKLRSSEYKLTYEDDGCTFHPQCSTCPLPQCRYDLGRGTRDGTLGRALRVLQMEKDGICTREMAKQLGTSRRTIFRLKHYLDPHYNSRGAPLSFHHH